uniref:AMP-binding domain-containing protein n=1 Tax=Macrostomum lignano TaxID=282301 RepID=A0A1I8FP31_9PLAT
HRVLTLADVRDLSLNAAGGLARHGIVDGAVLALFLHNCPERMIAGATLTLANPNFTASELAYQLRHSGAVAVVTQADKFEIAAKAAKEAGCVKYNRTVRPPVMSGPYLGVLPFYHIYVEEHGINVMHLVPPLVLFLLQHPLSERYNLSSVRQIYSAAAPAWPGDSAAPCGHVQDSLRVYGLTETSPITARAPAAGREASQHSGPDRSARVQPAHQGRQRRYLGRLYSRGTAGFNTGDIAVYDEFGYFKNRGRDVKELIKVKGTQVAPAELEDILLNTPFPPDERAGELPCAFVVPRPGVQLRLPRRRTAMATANLKAVFR